VNKVFCFGDSWGAGEELDRPRERPFADHFADALGMSCVNFSRPQSSTGMILRTVVDNVSAIDPDDVVLIVCGPDVRWYDQDSEGRFVPLTLDSANARSFFAHKTLEWFEYHQALFIYSMQKLLSDRSCRYIMALNYGDMRQIMKYSFAIDTDKFVSTQDLTSILLGKPENQGVAWMMQLAEDGPSENIFSGPYFEGCRWHPNEHGHRRIAELFLQRYPRLS